MNPAKIAPGLAHLAFPLQDLVLDQSNARLHDAQNLSMIADSLRRFGQDQVVLANVRDRVVVKGNGRVMAARLLNWDKLAVEFVSGDARDLAERSVIDNRTSETSRWDSSALGRILRDMDHKVASVYQFKLPSDSAGVSSVPSPDDYPSRQIKVTVGNRKTIDEAVRAFRRINNEPGMSEGRAIELIAADWLSAIEVNRGEG